MLLKNELSPAELSVATRKNLLAIGYDKLTSIQEKVIPLVLNGRDVIGQSHTGTGKTASFLIPALEKLEKNFSPQVLVLVPTRELALQVSEEARKLAVPNNLRVLTVYGGTPIQKQLNFLRRGVEVVIGTPGRIIDHLQRKSLATSNLKFVVLDEVDEMIGQGFLPDIKKIICQTPTSRQTLLFSATINPEVKTFSQSYLKNPEYVVSASESPQINDISQYYIETSPREKTRSLINFLRSQQPTATIIFANTKKRQIPLLIATDVAARGIDIKDVSHVINYDFPHNPEFYIHRIGRTGRGGKTGQAVSFVSSWKEKEQLKQVIQQEEYKIEKEEIKMLRQQLKEAQAELLLTENKLKEKISF
ncbi:21701_t:CDS:2 [Gigaspora margarita]|uniref:RNA helicase n=1 Tax=Gigaspora margarita TaxID=4874 RepID=A0ABM8VV85_GIGMA|nr:21701_t:CDS:2 [Gigaspora margarita]